MSVTNKFKSKATFRSFPRVGNLSSKLFGKDSGQAGMTGMNAFLSFYS